MKNKYNEKFVAFSLAEMMIVMVVVAIIMAAMVPTMTKRSKKIVQPQVVANAPVGAIMAFGGASAPDGWVLCDGRQITDAKYSTLRGVLGGSNYAPDLRGRTVIGLDNMGGTSADTVTSSSADTIGGRDGEEKHQLSVSEMPSHSHTGTTDSNGLHTHYLQVGQNRGTGPWVPGWGVSSIPATNFGNTNILQSGAHTHNVVITPNGQNVAHNNMQPYMALNYIIKY